MFHTKRPLVRWGLALILTIGLGRAHEAFGQNAGAIGNPAQQQNLLNPGLNQNPAVPGSNSNFAAGAFANPYLFVNPTPNVVQPLNPIVPSVNPNARGLTDPLGNPYPNVTSNPIANPNIFTPGVMAPRVTPNTSTLPGQGIGAGVTGTIQNNTGTGVIGGAVPSGGIANPSGVGGRGFDQIIE